ncbi:hypothetical protein Cma02nite_08350 [Cellulomonas marina]|nr:hypothetical protein Cma02nite_08350 [Cellulomonas marina]
MVRVLARLLAGLGTELLGLLLPVACAGCGRPDERWCASCRAAWSHGPVRCESRAGRWDRLDGASAPVWALADATGPARAVVVQWKDRGRTDLTPLLAALLRDAATVVAPDLVAPDLVGPDLVGPDLVGPAGKGRQTRPLLVVPVPSTAAARRRRGEHRVGRLVPGVAAGCRDGGTAAVAAPVLVRRGGRDQAGLGRAARARNLDDGVRLARVPRLPDLHEARVLLVDDVLTTGATLAVCRRVLERAGADVVGALVLASTPPPGSARAETPTAPAAP